jgi:hypothetical protein
MTAEGMHGPVPGGGGGDHEGRLREAYVERVLLPSLPPGRAVVMDNPRRQGREGARARRGAGLRAFVPAALLADRGGLPEGQGAPEEGAAARTRGALVEATGRALDAVTSRDARGWFGHCGYPLDAQPS